MFYIFILIPPQLFSQPHTCPFNLTPLCHVSHLYAQQFIHAHFTHSSIQAAFLNGLSSLSDSLLLKLSNQTSAETPLLPGHLPYSQLVSGPLRDCCYSMSLCFHVHVVLCVLLFSVSCSARGGLMVSLRCLRHYFRRYQRQRIYKPRGLHSFIITRQRIYEPCGPHRSDINRVEQPPYYHANALQ